MKVALPKSPINRVDLYLDAGFEVIEGTARTSEEMIELMCDADGAHVNTLPLTTRQVLEACPRLKVISRFGVGVDSIDLEAATEIAIRETVEFLMERAQLSSGEAYAVVSMAADLRITELVDGNVGVHVMVAKELVGG